MNIDETTSHVVWLALMGAVIGVGQLLLTKDALTPRIILGRAICSAALGVAASAALSLMPELPFEAQLGIGACLASLGTSFLEKIVQRYLGGS